MNTKLKEFAAFFEDNAKKLFEHNDNNFESLYSAMQYSYLDGGKRLRPFILSEFYKMCGKEDNAYFNFAAALEMIHVYSLIHDDLPSMDNDDFRRGKPSCHKAFGEDIALLAGDGLLTYAFETAANTKDISADRVVRAISFLANCAGKDGMIGGQVIDLEGENKAQAKETVLEMYSKKTGKLLLAAAVIGTILAGGKDKEISAAKVYAENLGIAFQIRDDILDIVGDINLLGKPIGSDDKNEKATYVSIVGLEKAEQDVKAYTNAAISALNTFGDKANTLKELAEYLVYRNH